MCIGKLLPVNFSCLKDSKHKAIGSEGSKIENLKVL